MEKIPGKIAYQLLFLEAVKGESGQVKNVENLFLKVKYGKSENN